MYLENDEVVEHDTEVGFDLDVVGVDAARGEVPEPVHEHLPGLNRRPLFSIPTRCPVPTRSTLVKSVESNWAELVSTPSSTKLCLATRSLRLAIGVWEGVGRGLD